MLLFYKVAIRNAMNFYSNNRLYFQPRLIMLLLLIATTCKPSTLSIYLGLLFQLLSKATTATFYIFSRLMVQSDIKSYFNVHHANTYHNFMTKVYFVKNILGFYHLAQVYPYKRNIEILLPTKYKDFLKTNFQYETYRKMHRLNYTIRV